jgi:hypothetical protein
MRLVANRDLLEFAGLAHCNYCATRASQDGECAWAGSTPARCKVADVRAAPAAMLSAAAVAVLGTVGSAAAETDLRAQTAGDHCCWFPSDRRDCSVAEARLLVLNFFRAFNAGNRRQLDRIFAKEPAFHWYSTGKPGSRFGAEAENRSTLMRYFARRHKQRERLKLLYWIGGQTPGGEFGFSFHILRQARELRPKAFEGKGALFCASHGNKIIVWSNGPEVKATPPRS